MTDAQIKVLWDLLFPDNDNREISPEDLRNGLIALLDALSARMGNLPSLTTVVKTSLVAAINSIKTDLDSITNQLDVQFGTADPNDVSPPIYSIGTLYVRQDNVGGNIVNTEMWIFTGVEDVGWANLTQTFSAVLFTPQTLSLSEKTQALKNLGYIEIEGNLFEYKRNPNNNTIGIVAGDIALNGWITATNFGRLLIYVSGSPTSVASWNVVDNIEF